MKIHFIGIGGIGISGIADVYHKKGNKVQGSDSVKSEITDILHKNGVDVLIGHKTENITEDIDLVIHSEAVPEDNIELKKAKELNIKCLTGAEAIGELNKEYFTIAVSGMHGKTTTASMIAHILVEAGEDPTYIIGTKNGSRVGKSEYLVIEADDYQAKFLNYTPDILVLTNIEEEHMDYFRDLDHILQVFKKYLSQVKKIVVANNDDKNVKKVIGSAKCEVKYFKSRNIELAMPGFYNQYNAAAALEAAMALGVEEQTALKALASFKGTWRRFEESDIKVWGKSFKVISDYAHHPTEINAVMKAVRQKYSQEDVWCVFQPHQYQRTFYLFNNFIKAFQANPIGKLIIIDVYDVEGRESQKIKQQVDSEKLAKDIGEKWAQYMPQNQVLKYLEEHLKGGEILMFMGAGADVYNLYSELIHS